MTNVLGKLEYLGVDISQKAAVEHPRDRIIMYRGADLGEIGFFPGFNSHKDGINFITESGLVAGRDSLRKGVLEGVKSWREEYNEVQNLLTQFYIATADLVKSNAA